MFKLLMRICHADRQKAAWFESDFFMLLTIYNGPMVNISQKCHYCDPTADSPKKYKQIKELLIVTSKYHQNTSLVPIHFHEALQIT